MSKLKEFYIRKKKTLKVILISVLALILLTVISAWIFAGREIQTLTSLKEITKGSLYSMEFNSDYGFDRFLETGVRENSAPEKFIKENLLGSGKMIPDTSGDACTAFMAKDDKGNVIYGRNLDIDSRCPGLVTFTNPQGGYASVSMVEMMTLGYFGGPSGTEKLKNPMDWKDRGGLFEAPYSPRDGMNQYGLAAATLNVPNTVSPIAHGKVTIGRWQANRLMLDHAKSVDEAVSVLEKYNISCMNPGVHYFVADASGSSAVIEFLNGRMVVTKNDKPWQVVTNFNVGDPNLTGGGQDRYKTAYDEISSKNGVLSSTEVFQILKKTGQSFTAWSVLYNLTTGEMQVANSGKFEYIQKFSLKK